MSNYVTLITVAAFGGIAVALQGQLMGLMDQRLGTKARVLITYGSGGLVVVLAALLSGGWSLKGWQEVPWYAFGTGLLGLFIVGTISYTVPRLGLTAAFTIAVDSQFILAALMDHFGLLGAAVRPLDLSRSFGIGVLILGVWALTFSGGVLGVLLAVLVSWLLLALLPALPSQIPLWAVVAGLTVSIGVGLGFGVWPARRAAALDPVEAPRYE